MTALTDISSIAPRQADDLQRTPPHTPPARSSIGANPAAVTSVGTGAPDGANLASQRATDDWQVSLISMLNDALATELVCVLRYKRHHYTAHGLAGARVAAEFMVHAQEETAHADRLARRIAQLGGEPDFAPDTLLQRSHAAYDASPDLRTMISADLISERQACETYAHLIKLVGERDSTTRRLLEDILAEEQAHATELAGWLQE
jgi:bacterioferritin